MHPSRIAFVAVILWLLLALVLDRWLISPYCETCVNVLALDLKFKLSVFKDYKPLTITASLSGLIGLAFGAYLFLAKGFRDIFK